ncbi:MAG: rod shape-determining protein MreC [Minisyncoccia bacterium]
MKQNYVIFILIFLILILIFLNPTFFWNFKKYLITNDSKFGFLNQEESLILKTKLNELNLLSQFLPKVNSVIPAFVYSKYPFNLKNEILINARGKNDFLNKAVVLLNNQNNQNSENFILIGKIKEVYENFSLVQTIFDSNFKLAVKVGESFSNALLVGGPNPKLTLISRDAKVKAGDVIISADSNWPYGLVIGNVSKIKEIENSLFNEAEIILPYDLNQINAVAIIK